MVGWLAAPLWLLMSLWDSSGLSDTGDCEVAGEWGEGRELQDSGEGREGSP